MSTDDQPVAFEAYEALASAYSAIAATKAENGHMEHPAMRAQIGDVSGLKVLDAGCGPGFLLRYLLDQGAGEVVGFDISPAMINEARKRVGDKVALHVADMAKPLDFLPGRCCDLIVSSLAIDYIRDWSVPLAEFRRVLVKGGRLVFSVQHPTAAWEWYGPPTAYGVHLCKAVWKGFTENPVTVPDHYRSFAEMMNPLIAAGFRLNQIKDVEPAPELREIDPRKYKKFSREPSFMIIDAEVV
ncbi:class I SAM-dependent methyltransferase [Parvularcula flava]|uniref:SAM-dependent methyltransferase n=1 Tax=Aquisalinus luteolus TaxID=1566827 RepID=A0A8J3ER60_9PROT|nr:class I SAM-dependent methyltransferase [Aquisalinus luteolus]NHK28287.1 class I SAM-dependent methyltransferase [Aquisalinus luteolus]GGH98027.1 SAM-dependent methyltransferase [Aquisalinus luteolus]